MRSFLKSALARLGLLEPAKIAYGTLKVMRLPMLRNEITYRLRGAPDGQPLPSPRLVYLVINHGLISEYYRSGAIVVARMRASLEGQSIDHRQFTKILDFGCGSGRLIRHWKALTPAALYGTDYNEDLIAWCRKHLKFANFQVNDLMPPLAYADNTFDFIYCQSVFTHLSQDVQQVWLREFCRILQNGGFLLFTTHGDQFLRFLPQEMQGQYRRGELVMIERGKEGSNAYGVFQSRPYTESHLPPGLKYVAHAPGSAAMHVQQDVNIVQKDIPASDASAHPV